MFQHDGEPLFKRPRRLCVGTTRDEGKPIYAEGFGEWVEEDCTFYDDDSDDAHSNHGFESRFHHTTRFWWAWNWNEVQAEEVQMADERDHWQEEAFRDEQEHAEHLRHLVASCELASSDHGECPSAVELRCQPRGLASVWGLSRGARDARASREEKVLLGVCHLS